PATAVDSSRFRFVSASASDSVPTISNTPAGAVSSRAPDDDRDELNAEIYQTHIHVVYSPDCYGASSPIRRTRANDYAPCNAQLTTVFDEERCPKWTSAASRDVAPGARVRGRRARERRIGAERART